MKGLNGWMRLIESSETSVLSGLLHELEQVAGSDETSGLQLAEVIRKDPSLSASIIRIANSAQFNPGDIPVTTISRAILNIGFKNIRSFCVSIKLLETVLDRSPSPLLVATLAKSLHAAGQAKMLCEHLNATQQEEVYVGSMMSNLAEILVLSAEDDGATELAKEVDAVSTLEEKNRVAERVLGVSITRLSKTLMKTWRIDGLVNEVLVDPLEPNDMVKAVQLGDEISRASILGWDSPEFEAVLKKIAEFKGKPVIDVKKEIMAVADQTAKTVQSFGKNVLNGHIPTSKTPASKRGKFEEDKKADALKPNQQVQLEVLGQLTNDIMSDFNINKVFKSVLLGINQGVGLERATLAIFEKGQQTLRCKYATGVGTEKWQDTFILKYIKSHSGFLYNLFEKNQIVWVGNPDHRHLTQYISGDIKAVTGQGDFFIAPLLAKGKKVGLIYADMGVSKRELTDQYFGGYCQFVQQVKLALSILASRS